MNIDLLSQITGWAGLGLSVTISLPQIIKSVQLKDTSSLSWISQILLFLAIGCYLVRAVIVGEHIFIASNAINGIFVALLIGLMVRYRR